MVHGARSELRKQMRQHQRLRMWTMIAVVVTLLGAIPLFLMIRAATRDPVFNSLDALSVPDWAAGSVVDETSGSRWCIIECRYRERSARSSKGFQETAKAYESALLDAGWRRWNPEGCPSGKDEVHTCWRRDEFTLDLYVTPPCADDPLFNRPTVGPVASGGTVPEPNPSQEECSGSRVLVKVTNAIEDHREEGEPTADPGLGVDIDPTSSASGGATP